MLVWWGPHLIQIYNDGYRSILGGKHPRSIGAPGRQVWSEIWHIVGPMADGILDGGPPTWSEHLLLPMNRKGFLEETYFTFSYSPIPDDQGGVGGVLVTVQETTEQVQSLRQLRTLRDLGASGSDARSPGEACTTASRILEDNTADVPFAMLYLLEGDSRLARLTASSGVPADRRGTLGAIQMDEHEVGGVVWPLGECARRGGRVEVSDIAAFRPLLAGPLAVAPERAVVIPLARSGEAWPYGFAVFGVSPTRALDDGYKGFLGLVADQIATAIARARSLEDARARADALEELDRAKTAFFSNVSHEFRTPLTLMLGPTEEALASDERVIAGENLELLHRNELRLLKLVNALLDFARIEAGRAQARYQPTDLAGFTADLASMFRSAVERAGLTLDVRCTTGPDPVFVDRTMWEQIVMNLLSNALKFTFDGGITVALRDTPAGVTLEVSDTGIGIAPHHMPQLFQRFHRIEGGQGRTHEGSGIGLAMVHELVRLHGGGIHAVSAVGEGTTFTVDLPRGAAHLPSDHVTESSGSAAPVTASVFADEAMRWLPVSEPADQAGPQPSPVKTGRLLVVDDNADMRGYLTRLLQSRWVVRAVANTDAALAAIAAEPPDLMITDVMMPGGNGLDFVRSLRQRPETADIPVIAVSARAGEEARLEGLRSGADEYLVKPFSPRELLVRVESMLAMARSTHERAELLERERQARVEAELQKQHLHDLFMQAPTLIAVLRGPQFIVELANEGICRAWGHAQASMVGRPLLDALADRPRQTLEPLLNEVFESGSTREERETPYQFDRPDGTVEVAYFNFVYSPFRGGDGRVAGIFVIASEVTDQVRARQQTDGLRRAAESANRAKDEFLAMLGHELRNPLSPIVTALQLMRLRGDGADRERTVIERQVAHLTRLVDDLLDVSRIARGKVELKVEIVEMADVVVKAIEMASPLLEQRAHALELDVPRRGLAVKGDATRLAQVVSNLLTNAAKYTPAGGRIAVQATRSGDAVELRVRDNGIGISADVMGHVFDLFVQEQQGLDRATGGLGLGLTIVRNLVQLHGGTVSAESGGMGKGSEFVVRLPLADPELVPDVEDERVLRLGPSAGASRRVLIVDDNADSAAMLAEALRLQGHDVRVAHDGPAALALSEAFQPHVALLDIGLPVMDGYELAARLRQRPGLEDLRLLALTGYGQESDSERSRAAGFYAHLVKPLDLRQLDQLLNVRTPNDEPGDSGRARRRDLRLRPARRTLTPRFSGRRPTTPLARRARARACRTRRRRRYPCRNAESCRVPLGRAPGRWC